MDENSEYRPNPLIPFGVIVIVLLIGALALYFLSNPIGVPFALICFFSACGVGVIWKMSAILANEGEVSRDYILALFGSFGLAVVSLAGLLQNVYYMHQAGP